MVRWGCTIDLERCVGCQSCVIACKAENGTPRNIHWMRVLEREEGGTNPGPYYLTGKAGGSIGGGNNGY